jgi:hypothetical protein
MISALGTASQNRFGVVSGPGKSVQITEIHILFYPASWFFLKTIYRKQLQ